MLSANSAKKILQAEFKMLHEQPVEGFTIGLVDDSDIFHWSVAIFGPPDTLYAGGYFKANMRFPPDYPYSPPTFRFSTKMFHSNIYESGEVCISILHSPGSDDQSGEHASERWNPTQNVRTILLSVVSLLNEPNISSPANVDASVLYRKWRDSKGKEKEYERIIKRQVENSKKEAIEDGIVVPQTVKEYCISTTTAASGSGGSSSQKSKDGKEITCEDICELDDFYDDDDDDDEIYDDDDLMSDDDAYHDDDSGAHDDAI